MYPVIRSVLEGQENGVTVNGCSPACASVEARKEVRLTGATQKCVLQRKLAGERAAGLVLPLGEE